MKKKFICTLLTVGLITGTAAPAFGAVDSQTAAITPVANATMEFTGTEIKLSLANTIKRMQTEGPEAENIELTKKSHELASKSSSEALSMMRAAEKAPNDPAIRGAGVSSTGTDGKKAKLARDYYKKLAEFSYNASMKNVESQATQLYYGVLQAQENYRISGEATKISETTYNHAKLKLNLGMITKKDLLQAESALLTAKSAEAAALTSLKNVKMAFNTAMGFDLMQKVTFTDKPVVINTAAIPLTDAINLAYENRTEIMGAKLAMQIADLELASLVGYPRDSVKYLSAQMELNKAKTVYTQSISGIEHSVRALYMALNDAKNGLAVSQATYENAKETARLTKLQYDAGLCTMADLQTAQNGEYLAQLGLSASILGYDLALYSYNNSPYSADASAGAGAGAGADKSK
ncbi:MAG: TolC family protein [Eubacteriales bacterium]|nr:TolC family protein [Eubacteriales bacterium]MDD4390810.1 TolC family protein [Eubacteriales bacterium]